MKSVIGLALPVLAAASPVVVSSIHNDAAPIVSTMNGKEIPGAYMIKFKKHVDHKSASDHHAWVHDIHTSNEQIKMDLRKRSSSSLVDGIYTGLKHTYNIGGDLLGYSGHFDDEVIEQIRRHPDVS